MRFRLRTLLFALTILSLGLGLWVSRAKQIASHRQLVERHGGEIWFDGQEPKGWGSIPSPLPKPGNDGMAKEVGRLAWLFPKGIWRVDFHRPRPWTMRDDPPLTNEVLHDLPQSGPIRELNIYSATQLNDRAFSNFEQLDGLTKLTLYMDGGKLTDAGVEFITKAPKLTSLEINGAVLTKTALIYLAESSVTELMLVNSGFTDHELAEFARRNPDITMWIAGEVYEVSSDTKHRGTEGAE